MSDPIATLTEKLADYMATIAVPWPDEGAMRRAVSEVVRLMATEAAPEALSLIHEMNPASIERDPDPIQSWQRDPPEEDGWYVAALDFPVRNVGSFHVVRLGPSSTGRRVAFSLSDGLADKLEDVSWWLVPAIPLPPIPEENP